MAKYSDERGREWSIELDVAMIELIRNQTGIDLLALVDGKLAEVLYADLSATASAIYLASKPAGRVGRFRAWLVDAFCAVMPQRTANAIQRAIARRFKSSMSGDAFERASDALLESLIDFFPNARRRQILRATWNTTRELNESASCSILSVLSSPQTIAGVSSGETPA